MELKNLNTLINEKNIRFIIVNFLCCFGLYLSSKLIEMSYEMSGGKIQPQYYNYIFVMSIAFGMLMFYQVVRFNGCAMLEEIKKRGGE